jgi:hypothetical protein
MNYFKIDAFVTKYIFEIIASLKAFGLENDQIIKFAFVAFVPPFFKLFI